MYHDTGEVDKYGNHVRNGNIIDAFWYNKKRSAKIRDLNVHKNASFRF